MSKEIYISSTPHETRLAIVENDGLAEIYYERENEYTLAGSIYNGKVTRVLPGMQSSFVDIGLERDAFLYITDFMEEAGDSADFDAGDKGSSHRRERRPAEVAAAPEGSAQQAGNSQPADDREEPRSERRGRRDRSDRSDRGDRTERSGGDQLDRSDRGGRREPLRDASAIDATPAPATAAAQPTSGMEEVGEGAPGADGSRRWRGRRGRRRGGRGTPLGTTPPGTTPQDGSPETSEAYDGANAASEDEWTPMPGESFSHGYMDASADTSEAADEPGIADPDPYEASAEDEPRRVTYSGNAQGLSRREMRDRQRQVAQADDAYRDVSGAGTWDTESASQANAESDAAHDGYPFGADRAAMTSASGELLPQLPGESLAKYRVGGSPEEPSAKAAPAPLPKPSTEYILQGDWQGGAALPGESLARYSGGRGESRGAREPREGREPRGRERAGRERTGPREGSALAAPAAATGSALTHDSAQQPEVAVPEPVPSEPTVTQVAPVEPGHTSQEPFTATEPAHASAAELAAHTQEASAEPTADKGLFGKLKGFADRLLGAATEVAHEDAAHEDSTHQDAAPAAAASEHAQHTQHPAEQVTAPAEFEPGEDASASLRAETTGRAEFRLDADSQPVAAESASAEPEYASPTAELVDFHPAATHEAATHESASQFTAIDAAGEMLSQGEPRAARVVDAEASPIDHEGAVQSVTEANVAEHAVPMRDAPLTEAWPTEAPRTDSSRAEEPHTFAPGDGQLEEELIDDEDDATLPTLHAATEYSDEETVEGSPDLGEMLREMSMEHGAEDALLADDDDEDEYEDGEIHEEELAPGEGDEFEPADEPVVGERFDEDGETEGEAHGEYAEPRLTSDREPSREVSEGGDREAGRRGARRGGRNGERGADRGGSGTRDRRPGGGGSHRNGGRMTRSQAQTSELPAISDLLKPGQEVLVQIAKEPMAKKGARITSHIALPGRFLVFMPTVSHVGVSRKIESDGERRRLKEILLSERGDASGGFIVRTAASGASEEELRSDLRFLLNLWADIKARSESSKSPALIYHDLNLIERILRDQVTDQFSAIWVDTEAEYERVLRFLQRFQPALIRRVKLYTKDTPLFEQFGITEEINKALRSKVWLKSGGSIVINQTEALVAIDINTGKFVGKTARLEDTIVKTNLDAIPEIVRQIRLRDLGGIIVIDFIDMDERKNRHKVLAALEEELKSDRAPSKVLQFNDFGLVAITRKRVKQSLERTLSTTCGVCAGTGMVKSPVTVANDIYVEMRKMQKHLDRGDVMLRVNPEVVKQLKAPGTRWLQEMEEMVGKTILVKSDPSLHPEQFDIH